VPVFVTVMVYVRVPPGSTVVAFTTLVMVSSQPLGVGTAEAVLTVLANRAREKSSVASNTLFM
jgi:hypothetical protein